MITTNALNVLTARLSRLEYLGKAGIHSFMLTWKNILKRNQNKISMLYADLNINKKINAKGNALVLYNRFDYKRIRRREGDCYLCGWLLKEVPGSNQFRNADGSIEVRY
jgi:hypothetical protein